MLPFVSTRMRSVCIALACIVCLTATLSGASAVNSHQDAGQHDAPLKYPSWPSSSPLSSVGVSHLEPIQGYTLLHEDNRHLHLQRSMGTLSNHDRLHHERNEARSLGAHSLGTKLTDTNLLQLFPNELTLEFHAWGQHFHLAPLRLMTDLFAPNSRTEVHDAASNSTSRFVPNTLQSYHVLDATRGIEATVTMHRDGLFHALIHTYSIEDGSPLEAIQVDPLHMHAQHIRDHRVLSTLRQSAPHGMVAFKHSQLTSEARMQTCGAKYPPGEGPESSNENEQSSEGSSDAGNDDGVILHSPLASSHSHTSMHRRRLFAALGQGIEVWNGCYPGSEQVHKVSMGVGADVSYYEMFNDVPRAQAAIASVFANTNLVYRAQMFTMFQVADVLIQSSEGGVGWNNKPATKGGKCSISINANLDAFTSWRSTVKPKNNALWHHFTNCYPPAGTVGLAWINVICSTRNGCGLSSYTQTHWLVVAHEIGHNFGGNHAFQEGQGKTGGIMDYGDGVYPLKSGIIQFNTKYNRAEMCAAMTKGYKITGITPFCAAVYNPTCGNKVVEAGEDCDDATPCCVACKFKAGAVCSIGDGGSNTCCDSSCQFKPSSTSCGTISSSGALQSFCANGVCTTSACAGYSNLQYCGTAPGNACRQQCMYNGKCTDSLTTPSAASRTMPDGTVCNLAPYSTCQSGSCQTSGSTPSQPAKWVTSNPSICSCEGQQTLTVSCQDAAGNVVPSSQCSGAPPASTGACTAPASCASWKAGGFGACSANCGSGTQTQTVQCVSTAGVVVDVSLCAGASKPASSRACPSLPACPIAWVEGGWSTCTQACGGGVQTQTVQCMQTQNGVKSLVIASACAGQAQPASQRACQTDPCGTLAWQYGPFGACSVTCGGGDQLRESHCMQSGVQVDATLCQSSLGAPLTYQACNTSPCPNREWRMGDFGTCSVTCGGGTQTRLVQCFDVSADPTLREPLEEDLCVVNKPNSMQSCNTQACVNPTSPVHWFTTAWSKCSGECATGGGFSFRFVSCINLNNIFKSQSDSLCAALGPKPPALQECNKNGCGSYEWTGGDWTSCTSACGSGSQTRSVMCQDRLSRSVVSNTFCQGTTALPSTQACNTEACLQAPKPNWKLGVWSACSQVCGGGFRTRLVQCVDQNGAALPNSASCPSPAPETQSACGTEACGTYWWSGEWTQCSALCGVNGGTQTRAVACFKLEDDPKTTKPLQDTQCSNSKPSTQSSCNVNPCPTYVASDSWGPCSARCGQGLQTRNVTCTAFDGSILDKSQCSGAPLPSIQRICEVQQCPHWHRGEWGSCSELCGGGTQNRSLACRMPHSEPTYGMLQPDTSLCPPPGMGDVGDGAGLPGVAAGKPSSVQSCNIDPCPKWSACSASCAGGVQTTTATCTNTVTSQAVAPALCLDAKPNTTIACNADVPCPLYEYALGKWSKCEAFCGPGVQRRTLTCQNVRPDASMHLPAVSVDASFCVKAGVPTPSSTQPCELNPVSVCWGAASSTSGTTSNSTRNGRCDSATGQCLCRSGTVGPDCTERGPLGAVQTNGAQFTAGIPLGEVLQISWNSSLSLLPTVNIILTKDLSSTDASSDVAGGSSAGDDWGIVGEYLAQNVPNSGYFQWVVGSLLRDGVLQAGAGYRVRVWFSPNLYSESPAFLVGNPCAYKNCGVHGTCARGNCTCEKGYEGHTCETGPCERANCASETSTCNNTLLITSPPGAPKQQVCVCKDGWTGPHCRTPPSCPPLQCLNGGDFDTSTGTVLGGATNECSGACRCPGSWTGNRCQKCGLSCLHGRSDSKCRSCQCQAGWQGARCHCKYVRLSMPLRFDWAAAGLHNDSQAAARFSRTLASDMVYAGTRASAAASPFAQADVAPVEAHVESLAFPSPMRVQARVQYGLKCADLSMDAVGGYGEESGEQDSQDQSEQEESGMTEAEKSMIKEEREGLARSYAALVPLFGDRDSAVFHGQVTQFLASGAAVVADDPSGELTLLQPMAARDCFEDDCSKPMTPVNPEEGGSGGISTTFMWILIGVGAGVLVIGAVAASVWMYRRKQLHRAMNDHRARMEASIAPGSELATRY